MANPNRAANPANWSKNKKECVYIRSFERRPDCMEYAEGMEAQGYKTRTTRKKGSNNKMTWKVFVYRVFDA